MKNWMKSLLLIVAGILFLIAYFGFLWIVTGLIFNIAVHTDWILQCCGIVMLIFVVIMLAKDK